MTAVNFPKAFNPVLIVQTCDQKKPVEWKLNLTQELFETALKWIEEPPQPSAFDTTILVPLRTNKEHIIGDLFFPLLEVTEKTDHFVIKAIKVCVMLAISWLCLPIRLITLLPRMVVNLNRPENKLHQLLREKQAPKEILETDMVNVEMRWHIKADKGFNRCSKTVKPYCLTIAPFSGIHTDQSFNTELNSETLSELNKLVTG